MADPTVTLTNGVPTSGSGVITTLGQLIDPTNGPAAIKAASTAPVAADKAIVVAMSPNSAGIITLGTAGTAATNVMTVQGIASMTPMLFNYAEPANFVSGATAAMTGTTTTSLIAAPAAGLRNYITQITVSNSHATVGTDILIQDGSGGATLYVVPAAAVYGGAVLTFPTPLRQPTAATALFCANVVTGASTRVSASGYKGA
jgi:hypothetical protein